MRRKLLDWSNSTEVAIGTPWLYLVATELLRKQMGEVKTMQDPYFSNTSTNRI